MTKQLKISGMSCGHCVSHVKSALEGVEGVSEADVSLENDAAQVTLSDDVVDGDLIAAVEAAGYQAEVR
jgi:copper chaperone CopZ